MNRVTSSGVVICLVALLAQVGGIGLRLDAQDTQQNGTIFGTISDQLGAVLPGANIEVTSPALQGTKTVTTGGEGAYRISDLPAGTYRISYSRTGFQTEIRSNFVLTAGFSARVDVALKAGSVQQTVEVTGEAPVVDVSTTVISSTLTRSTLDDVPTTRSIFQAVYMAPGVRPSATPDIGGNQLGQQQSLGAYGYAGNTVPLIDGINVLQSNSLSGTDAPGDFVDYDALEELKVISTSADADIGPPGTALVTVMKTGGNEFHGDARGMKEWNGFQGTNLPSTFPGGSSANQLQNFYDIFGDAGGRIKRDKLWFYGGVHFQRKSISVIGYIGQDGKQGFDPLKQDNQEAKMTYQVTKKIKIIGSGSDGTKYENQRNGSNLVPFNSTFTQYDNYYAVKGELVWTPTSNLIIDLLAGNYWQPYGYPNQPGVAVAGNPWIFNSSTQQITGANINVGSSDEGEHKRAQTTGSVGYFRGKHSFQFGYMAFLPQADTKTFLTHPAGNYELQFQPVNGVLTPLQIVTYNFPLYASGNETALGLYAKDTWRVSKRLTLNPGVRFDRYRGYHDKEHEGGGPFYASADYPAQTDYTWYRVVPRIGAAYDLTGNGTTVIRGSYGIYNLDELGQFDIDNYNPAAIISNTYKWTGPCQATSYTNCDATPATLANLGTGTTTYISTTGGAGGIVNPDLRMPFMQTASATFEREIRPSLAFRALYVYNRENDMFDQTFPNRPPSSYSIPYNTTYPAQDPANAGKPLTILTYPASLVCPKSTPFCSFNQNMLVTRQGNADHFNTVEVTVTKRQSGRWSALASFDLTKNHKSLSTSPIFGSYQSAANPVAPYEQAFPLDETWDWALKSFFTYSFPLKIQLGLNYQFLAGAPNYRTDRFTGVPQLGTVTIPVESWGAERNPPLNLLNIRTAKIISIGEKRSLTATLELFNALNASPGTTINYLSGTGTSTFGTVSAVLPPIIGRAGLQFKF